MPPSKWGADGVGCLGTYSRWSRDHIVSRQRTCTQGGGSTIMAARSENETPETSPPDSIVIPDDEDEEETLHTETTEEDEIMGTETSTGDSVRIKTLDEHTGAQDMINGW